MSQDQVIVLLFKVGCIAGFISLVGWVIIYTRLARWWKNPIGRTLVVKTLLIAGLLVPTTMSLFFNFNRLTSHIAAWVDVVLIGAIAPVMIWRSIVWLREARDGRKDDVALLECRHHRAGRLRPARLVVEQ